MPISSELKEARGDPVKLGMLPVEEAVDDDA